MKNLTLVSQIASEVKLILAKAEGGHDWWHINRVWQNAITISKDENVDQLVVELAALLHDIADSKFNDGNEEIGPSTAKKLLNKYKVSPPVVEHVVNIIRYMSFKNSLEGEQWTSPELLVVQDADRLDAIGAIGIARAFNYGGYKKRQLYNPEIHPLESFTKQEYKASDAPTINHFYEKLLKLKDKMNTKTALRLAISRHKFMLQFLDQFYSEIGDIPLWHKN